MPGKNSKRQWNDVRDRQQNAMSVMSENKRNSIVDNENKIEENDKIG